MILSLSLFRVCVYVHGEGHERIRKEEKELEKSESQGLLFFYFPLQNVSGRGQVTSESLAHQNVAGAGQEFILKRYKLE